jgi:hypothetical protein
MHAARSLLLGLALFLLSGTTLGKPTIGPGHEEQIKQLVAAPGWGRALPGGFVLDQAAIDPGGVHFWLRKAAPGGEGPRVGEVVLDHVSVAAPGETTSRSFVIRRKALAEDPAIDGYLRAATASIVAQDQGDIYQLAMTQPRQDAVLERPLSMQLRAGALGLLLAAGLAGLVLLARRTPTSTEILVKRTHLLPMLLQSSIFLYWAVYFPPTALAMRLFPAQLLFAYALEATISLLRGQKIRLSLAPVPVVLSLNLFLQFAGSGFYLSILVIALALLSKSFLVRKDGGHIFNPSGFAIAAFGLLHLTVLPVRSGDVSFGFNAPPNMTEFILLIALVTQTRVPIVLMSQAAALAIRGCNQLAPHEVFFPSWAPMTLVVTLLITDPATTPRTGPGRVLFGATFGAGVVLAGNVLLALGLSDFYGKVLPIVLVNLLVPWFDRAGARLPPWASRWLEPARNRWHIALYWAVIVSGLRFHKPAAFVGDYLLDADTPLVTTDGQGHPTCEVNPVFCRSFSFAGEARCWQRRWQGDRGVCAAW